VGGEQRLIAVVGMVSEAKLLAGCDLRVIIGGGQARRLEADLEAELAAGAAGVISFGLCGALEPGLCVADVVIASAVVTQTQSLRTDPAWVERLKGALPEAKVGALAARDEMAPDVEAKAALRRATGALAVDMESHIVAALARRHGVPFAVLRAVSDTAAHTLPEAARVGLGGDGKPDLLAVLLRLSADPRQLPALIRTGRDAGAAHRALSRTVGETGALGFQAFPGSEAFSGSKSRHAET
jgi:hopanoid-associated phosphorylase